MMTELAYWEKECSICRGFCPAGTLESGLCIECEALPKAGEMINVHWGQFGFMRAKVRRVTRHQNVYAARWNKKRETWTSDRRLMNERGYWELYDAGPKTARETT